MREHWERVRVTGKNGEKKHNEIVLCRRGENALVMAFRRNKALAECMEISAEVVEAFVIERKGPEPHRKRAEITRDSRQEEWEWQ